jgi:hypothetical protein
VKLPVYKVGKGIVKRAEPEFVSKYDETVEAEFGVPEMTEERRCIEGFSAPEDDPPSTQTFYVVNDGQTVWWMVYPCALTLFVHHLVLLSLSLASELRK